MLKISTGVLIKPLLIFFFFFGEYHISVGREIMNGYAGELNLASKCIKNIEDLIRNESIPAKKEKLLRLLKTLERKENHIRASYDKTELLINKFQLIDPYLYNQMRFLKNKNQNITDIYIKIVSGETYPGYNGITRVNQDQMDQNVCSSSYGRNSASIEIADNFSSLVHLAHEFGHLMYIIPNLSDYINYYHLHYNILLNSGKLKGHDDSDLSGQSAQNATKHFISSYRVCNISEKRKHNSFLFSSQK